MTEQGPAPIPEGQDPGWAPVTVRLGAAWAAIELDEAELARAIWQALVVPLPPIRRVADLALAAGEVAVAVGGQVVAVGRGDEPAATTVDALVTAAHRWLTPSLVSTLVDLSVPLETLERFAAALPPAAQTTLLTRLVGDRIALADLPLLAEVCVAEVLGLRLQGVDPAGLEPAQLDDALEVACRLAIRRRISLGVAGRGQLDVVHVTSDVAAAVALERSPVTALVAALAAADGLRPTCLLAVPVLLRRRLRNLLAPSCPALPVLAAEELIATLPWRMAATIDRLPDLAPQPSPSSA